MLICGQVIAEEGTQKKSLIGIFDNIYAPSFPASLSCAIYAKLRDAYGGYEIMLRFVKQADETTLMPDARFELNATEPSGAAEIVVNFIGATFPEPGGYEFQLYADGMYLHRVVLDVKNGEAQWPAPPKQ